MSMLMMGNKGGGGVKKQNIFLSIIKFLIPLGLSKSLHYV